VYRIEEYSAAEPQPKRGSPCSPCFSSFNAEDTEDLSDLCVEAVLSTEVTEAPRAEGKMFAAHNAVGSECYRVKSAKHFYWAGSEPSLLLFEAPSKPPRG